jgi:hypothetical protein
MSTNDLSGKDWGDDMEKVRVEVADTGYDCHLLCNVTLRDPETATSEREISDTTWGYFDDAGRLVRFTAIDDVSWKDIEPLLPNDENTKSLVRCSIPIGFVSMGGR